MGTFGTITHITGTLLLKLFPEELDLGGYLADMNTFEYIKSVTLASPIYLGAFLCLGV